MCISRLIYAKQPRVPMNEPIKHYGIYDKVIGDSVAFKLA